MPFLKHFPAILQRRRGSPGRRGCCAAEAEAAQGYIRPFEDNGGAARCLPQPANLVQAAAPGKRCVRPSPSAGDVQALAGADLPTLRVRHVRCQRGKAKQQQCSEEGSPGHASGPIKGELKLH